MLLWQRCCYTIYYECKTHYSARSHTFDVERVWFTRRSFGRSRQSGIYEIWFTHACLAFTFCFSPHKLTGSIARYRNDTAKLLKCFWKNCDFFCCYFSCDDLWYDTLDLNRIRCQYKIIRWFATGAMKIWLDQNDPSLNESLITACMKQ